MLCEVRCLKSTEDMILALAGQFKQLSHEPEKFRRLNGIRTHDLWSTAPASQRSWVRIPWSHLKFSGSWDSCLNCPASARIISSIERGDYWKFPTLIGYTLSDYYVIKQFFSKWLQGIFSDEEINYIVSKKMHINFVQGMVCRFFNSWV